MHYVKVYFEAGTNTVKHVICQETPFSDGQFLEDSDVELEEVEYQLEDVTRVINARNVMDSIDVNQAGRVSMNQRKAEAKIPNVAARGLRPRLIPVNGHQRISRARAKRK